MHRTWRGVGWAIHTVRLDPQAMCSVFTGLATYDDFLSLDPDISEILLLTAAREVPLLDALPQPDRPATSVKHIWDEQNIGPDRIIASTAINSATAATGLQTDGLAALLSVGMLLELEPPTSGTMGVTELVQITSIPGPNSLLVARGVNGAANINSLAAGGTLFVIATAELEGDDTDGDVSRARTQRSNFTQIFKKPLKLSGTRQAVITRPNVGSEMDHQKAFRTIELLKELEKAVIRSVAINTIGDDASRRTMDGLRAVLTQINSQIASNSFTADPMLYVNNLMQAAWNAGARDIDILLTGAQWGRDISGTNTSKLLVGQQDESIQRYAENITTDFGTVRKIVSPWMPPQALMGLSTRRIFVTPMTSRNFHEEALAKGGDYDKAQIIGEYTLEYHHPEQMFQARQP